MCREGGYDSLRSFREKEAFVQTLPTAFISHASKDAALAQQLCEELERAGVRCWIAPRDIPPGQPWPESIVEGIEGCSAFVLLATTTSVVSRDVLIEVERAHRLARPIYTVMVDQPQLSREMTYYLTRLQWLETKEGGVAEAGSRLSEVLIGTKHWKAVSTPPSLRRRIASTMPSFAGAMFPVLAGLLLLGGALWYFLHRVQRAVAQDYRSIGWVTFDGASSGDIAKPVVVGHVWLGDPATSFSQVQFRVRILSAINEANVVDITPQFPREGTRETEFSVSLPKDASTMTSLLSIPRGVDIVCVQQKFRIASDQFAPTDAAQVLSPQACASAFKTFGQGR